MRGEDGEVGGVGGEEEEEDEEGLENNREEEKGLCEKDGELCNLLKTE
mgnify:CR=1|tara:strand:+ start:201 stop:344 length:144 start_codon:yes stop_codon:yes gene_type:complete